MTTAFKVRFRITRVVDDCRKGTPAEERYEAGAVYDMPEDSAARWVNRGVAEIVTDAGPAHDDGRPIADGGADVTSDRSVDELRAEAQALGIDVKPRWGATRIAAEIAKAREV